MLAGASRGILRTATAAGPQSITSALPGKSCTQPQLRIVTKIRRHRRLALHSLDDRQVEPLYDSSLFVADFCVMIQARCGVDLENIELFRWVC